MGARTEPVWYRLARDMRAKGASLAAIAEEFAEEEARVAAVCAGVVPPPFGWTEERVETLKQLHAEGHSAAQIAAALGGGVSRNAVIGKVHRLRLPAPAKREVSRALHSAVAKQGTARKRLIAATVEAGAGFTGDPDVRALRHMPPAPRRAPLSGPGGGLSPCGLHEPPAPPAGPGITLLQLTEKTCRWPMGDPARPEFRFCGAVKTPGPPYCPYHAVIAYQPAPKPIKRPGGAVPPRRALPPCEAWP